MLDRTPKPNAERKAQQTSIQLPTKREKKFGKIEEKWTDGNVRRRNRHSCLNPERKTTTRFAMNYSIVIPKCKLRNDTIIRFFFD